MSFKKFNQSGKLRKVLQMGALVAEAGSKGSAGNIASKIVESNIEFNPFDEQNTDDAAGGETPQQKARKKNVKLES